jgi:hypothetical protein
MGAMGALTACAAAVFILRGARKEKMASPSANDGFQDENNINPLYEGASSMADNPLYNSAIEEEFDLDSTQ